MWVKLEDISECGLLQLLSTITMQEGLLGREARRLGLPIGELQEKLICGLRIELVRRWQRKTGPPVLIEMPRFTRSERAHLREMLSSFERAVRDISRSADETVRPFFEEAAQVIGRVVAALPDSDLDN